MSKVVRLAIAAAIVAGVLFPQAVSAEDRVLIFSAYPAEQAVLLREAQVAKTPIGVFNGRRFFAGTIAAKKVILGLTGIGLVNAERTTIAALQYFAQHPELTLKGIVFSGVAGGPHIGDVVIPDRWSDGGPDPYDVDPNMLAVAQSPAVRNVALNPFLPVEDVTCTGQRLLLTPIELTVAPQILVGGLGSSGDPYGGRAVPCLSSAGGLEGCEACGAPLNTSPDVEKFVTEALPLFDPQFFQDLLLGGGSGGGGAVVGDQETAAVARVAAASDIPFIAFRAVSDGAGDPIILSAMLGFPFQFFIYQQLAADNAATVVIEFLKHWPSA